MICIERERVGIGEGILRRGDGEQVLMKQNE